MELLKPVEVTHSFSHYTQSTNFELVGSFTIPAGTACCISVTGVFYTTICTGVALSTNATDYKNACAIKMQNDENHPTCTYCCFTTTDTTFYVWGKWNAIGTNHVNVTGFYIPIQFTN